jgi:hypothetical protein
LQREEREKEYKNDEERRERKYYDDFIKLLDLSTEDRYILGIFADFASENKNVNKYLEVNEKEKFKILLKKFLFSYNPITSGLKYDPEDKTDSKCRVSSYIGHYGYAIICADMLNLDVSNFRQNIINYIPFAYSGQFQTIKKIIEPINKEELKSIIEVYREKKDDLWRFMPNNLFDIANNYPEIVSKLESLFVDYLEGKNTQKAYNHYKINALKVLENHHNNKYYLKGLIKKYKNDIAIINEANTILISKYNDKDAILKRIKFIIENPFEFEYLAGSHSVGPEENEIYGKYFAAPLMGLMSDKFINDFLNLLEKSYKVYKRGKKYGQYAYYMSEIVIAYFNNLKYLKDINNLKKLEDFNNKYLNEDGYGITLERIGRLKKKYLDYIGKPDNINTCINRHNKIKNEQYILINNNWQLFELLKKIIENDLNDWIKVEGRKMIDDSINETGLQKLLKLQFENLLLRKGFRTNDFYVYREPQNLDDSRTDFLIGYGFVSPVLIELKLSSSTDFTGRDLSKKESFYNMKKYVSIQNTENSIFLVYNNKFKDNKLWINHLRKIDYTYKQIEGVTVIGIPT